MSSIFPILLILGGIAGFALARPVWTDVSALRIEKTELGEITSSIDKSVKRKNELIKELDALPQDDRARLKLMIPEESRREDILLILSNIGRKNSVTLKSIAFTEAQARVAGDFASVDTSVTISGNYANIVEFIKDVEASLRLTDIERASLNTSGSSTLDMQLVLRSYYVEKILPN